MSSEKWEPSSKEAIEGCYKGLLCKPEYSREHEYVQWFFKRKEDFFNRLCLHDFPLCCGIKVMCNFEQIYNPYHLSRFGYDSNSNKEFKTREHVWKSYCIYRIEERLEKNNNKEISEVSYRGGKYIIVALNEIEIDKGIGDMLEKYFGFQRLEHNFRNIGESPKIGIWGLCFSEFEV